MPELPEVQTTVNGLRSKVIGLTIKDAWTNYNSPYYKGSKTIKDPSYFQEFKKLILGKKIISAERRAKNVLINLSGGTTIIVHMKMTGHLLYGLYKFNAEEKNDPWEPLSPEGLKDPFNRRVRFMLKLNNNHYLALSDTRRFAKVAALETKTAHSSLHLGNIGPEPLDKDFTSEKFISRIDLRPNGKIKQVLVDQEIIAGIGNIYADESLWHAEIHPTRKVSDITKDEKVSLYKAIRTTLSHGIDFGGDSMSDYRNIDGEKGKFQEKHHAYKRKGQKCDKPKCGGTITRIVVGGRGTHFCNKHQK